MTRLRMTEADYASRVVDYAWLSGWRAYHPPDNLPDANGRVQNVQPGFPDWVFLRAPRLEFMELKRLGGRVTTAQRNWVDELNQVTTVRARILTPDDWPEVQHVLRRDWVR